MGHVYYHHPGDKQFSLDFVNSSPDEVISRIVAYDDEVAVKVSKYDLDRELYVVYTSRAGGETVRDMKFDLHDVVVQMDDENGTIVVRLLEIYQSVLAQNEEEENTPVEAYKNIHIDELSDALDRVAWAGTATAVAGRLASNLVLNHALPNANHRTAVALVRIYLRRLNPDVSIPETAREIDPETYDWRDWVN